MTRTILIVEDSADCAETLELALGRLPGVSVRSVASAEQALDEIAGGGVALVITDLHLTGMDGLEFLTAMQGQSARAIPAIMISGDSDPMTPSRALLAGAAAFFAKPYSPAAVRRSAETLLLPH